MIVQGSSSHTARKEFEIEGLTKMRLMQFKNRHFRYQTIICADVFSGTGSNEIGGEIIDGSPIKLLNGYSRSNNTERDFLFWFSDVRPRACEMLEHLIATKFTHNNLKVSVTPSLASDAINVLGNALQQMPEAFLYLILDPNGPKDFPKNEVEDLLSSFPRRVDVVSYISATTINRCIGARNKAGMDFKGWLGQIENFDQGFVSALTLNDRSGWIRKPTLGDAQRWTMLPTFGCMKPHNEWNKQGFVDLESEEGKNVIKYYCGDIGNKD